MILGYFMIKARINKRIEKKFRELTMRMFGRGKEANDKAVEDAILKWISQVEKEQIFFEKDPVEMIEGILSEIESESVDLQHKIGDIWVSKLLKKTR
jgi:phage-related protein